VARATEAPKAQPPLVAKSRGASEGARVSFGRMEALPEPQEVRLVLPAEPQSVPLGRHAVQDLAARAGFDEQDQWRVGLAVTEALSNAIMHAYRGEPEPSRQRLHLLAEYDAQALVVTVLDDGVGLSPRSDSPGLGVGLALIATNADDVDIETRPGGGTSVQLTFTPRPSQA
jgi:serine/threonine-protein kinase RsbW